MVGTGDFTLDFRIRFAANQANSSSFFSNRRNGVGVATQWYIGTQATTNCLSVHSGAAAIFDNIANPLSNNTWYHIAIVRSGTNLYFFIDGILISTTASVSNDFSSAENFSLGGNDVFATAAMNGWMDELRFSIGIARWTANFTPPNAEYAPGGFFF